jgi:thioredoxin 1
MKRFVAVSLLAVCAVTTGLASEWPYDEKADAAADVQHALTAARTDHKKVLLVFGANWCADCRALDRAMHGSSHSLLASKFDVVKIDVGNFDKNTDLSQRYGNPTAKGIPTVVVLSADNRVLYATHNGELANARDMGDQGIYDFLSSQVAAGAKAAQVSAR